MIRIQQVENGDIVFREEENPDEDEGGEDEDAQEDEHNDLYDEPNAENLGEDDSQDDDTGIAALHIATHEDHATSDTSNSHANEAEEFNDPIPWDLGGENIVLQPSTQPEEALGAELPINDEEVDVKDNVEFPPAGYMPIGMDPLNADLYVPNFHFPSGFNLAQYSGLRSTINEQDGARAYYPTTAEPTSNDEPEPMDTD